MNQILNLDKRTADFELRKNMNTVLSDGLSKALKPKKVTLIACPWLFFNEVEFQSQHLGLGYVGAYAQKYGHTVHKFIDPMLNGGHLIKQPVQTKLQVTNRFGHTDEWIVKRIPKDTDVIGINAPFTDSRLALYPLVKAIKKRFPKIPVVIGGILGTTLPEQVLEECPADVVVRGEGEIAFAKILNDEPWENIPGLAYRDSGGSIVVHPKRSEQLRDIAQIPPPGYDFRPMRKYALWSPRGDKAKNERTLSIISSRGCPFTCSFCSIPEKGQVWRPFTPERILEEIKYAITAWGINHIEFEDDNFTLTEKRALAVLQYLADIREKGYPITCSFPNGIMIDRMSEALARLLIKAGCDIVYLPVESGDTRVLVSMDKPEAEKHLETTREVAQWCVDAGLNVSCFFIVGYPGGRPNKKFNSRESLAKYDKYLLTHPKYPDTFIVKGEDTEAFETTLEYARGLQKLGVQSISPLIATPYPGTELYQISQDFGWLAFEDYHDVLTTVSYAAMNPGRVQINTPWCSQDEMYNRWQHMMEVFPTLHNVRKADDKSFYTDKQLRALAAKAMQ